MIWIRGKWQRQKKMMQRRKGGDLGGGGSVGNGIHRDTDSG